MGTNVAAKIRAVVLLSGGMDSVITAALAKAQGRDLAALTIDYGQTHRREIAAARWQAKRLGIRHHVVLKLPLGSIAVGSLVDGTAIRRSGIKKGRPSTYVSFRNGVFLAAAASFAEAVGAREIWGGWCFTDQAGYPDCTPAFFRAFERSVDAGTWAGRDGVRFSIQAPLGVLSKAASVRLGQALSVDFKHTWTCYQPSQGGRACGLCDACRLRTQGFSEAKVLDPLTRPKVKKRKRP
jgi:7-cyano-7-deazaguanine synthase